MRSGAGKNADVMADQLMNQHGVRERVNELKEAILPQGDAK